MKRKQQKNVKQESLFLVDVISWSSSSLFLASTIPVTLAPYLVYAMANGLYGPSSGVGLYLFTPQFICQNTLNKIVSILIELFF